MRSAVAGRLAGRRWWLPTVRSDVLRAVINAGPAEVAVDHIPGLDGLVPEEGDAGAADRTADVEESHGYLPSPTVWLRASMIWPACFLVSWWSGQG